ncbi:MAG: (d)CMP kinase [Nitrospirae bacterium]|nr:(d)CMP kinase [Nitrospirota bacterium]
MKKVVAIDGPSGAGKSTLAKLVARELGFDYLDTGALYRATAVFLVRQGLEENASDDDIASLLSGAKVEFRNGRVFVNGSDVSDEIRAPGASHYASVFSARLPVRKHLLDIQREAAVHADLVAEGRDMTTVVFPSAYKKIYLDASVGERTRRRATELAAKGFEADEQKVRTEIIERDARDSGRDLSPLKKADDAILIDSTGLRIDEVMKKVIEVVKE